MSLARDPAAARPNDQCSDRRWQGGRGASPAPPCVASLPLLIRRVVLKIVEEILPTLSTDSGEITVSDRLIVRMASRLWRLSPAQRAYRVDRARRLIDSGRFGLNDAATVLAVDHNGDVP